MWYKKYLLSICIPTYNREKYLKILLDSIIYQKQFTDEIEIVIDDWPSNDNTEKLVKEYQKKHKNIRYLRNTETIGMLPAILEAISFSNGKYTRLFWSDDFMQKNSLEIVLNIIKNKQPTLILSNRFVFDNINECKKYKTESTKSIYFQWFSEFSIYLWLDEKEKYEDKWNYFTFMSIYCFETDYYQQMLDFVKKSICNIEELNKNYFNYIVILFSKLTPDRTICIVESPRLVFCQTDNHWWRLNKNIFDDYIFLANLVQETYQLTTGCKKFLKKNIRWLWMALYIYSPIINSKLIKLIKYWEHTKKIYRKICNIIAKMI